MQGNLYFEKYIDVYKTRNLLFLLHLSSLSKQKCDALASSSMFPSFSSFHYPTKLAECRGACIRRFPFDDDDKSIFVIIVGNYVIE